ncbi:MAG: glycosyltransferase family 39 protein [Candidatus Peribacteraceae bacterium]|nr:glycosyltransferase family 39 protein [Candidatus Peribacteraceae bacterium]
MKPWLSFRHRYEWLLLPILLGLAFFLIQLTQLSQYGATWDEPLHRNWGHLFDVFLRSGDREVLRLMPGNGIEYGPVYYLLGYWISEWLMGAFALPLFEASHVLNLITASIAVGCVFAFARSIAGKKIAWFSLMFFVLSPQFIAHAHYNPKDIPLLLAVLIASHVFLKAINETSNKLFILSGFLFGAAVALKVSALLMGPAVLGAYFVWLFDRKQQGCHGERSRTMHPALLSSFDSAQDDNNAISGIANTFSTKNEAFMLFLAVAAFLIGLILLWPTAWGDLLLIPRAIRFFLTGDYWPGTVLFFGKQYGGAELPWYYTVLEYAMAMPVVMIVFLVSGFWFLVRSMIRQERLATHTFLLLWIAVPMLLSMKSGLVRYDGMRQFFFTLPAVAVIAAIGLDTIIRLILKKLSIINYQLSISVVIVFIVVASLIHEVAILHPFEGSYRNEIVRLMYPERMDRVFNLEYWGATYKQGVDWLNANASQNAVVCVPTADVLIDWYDVRPDLSFGCSADASYMMFFTRYSKAEDPALVSHEPVFTVERMGAELLRIYKL